MGEELIVLLREFKIPLIIGAAGIFFLLLALIFVLPSHQSNVAKVQIEETAVASNSAQANLRADINGAVVRPGVYQMPYGSRVDDLVIAAGGVLPEADVDYIAKVLNRAQKLSDGAKIYIPKKGENLPNQVLNNSQGKNSGSLLGINTRLININSASLADLDSLPGIGLTTAEKIISGRPYQRIEELMEKKIVNKATWEKIKDKLMVQ